ncbi:hypothetical protein BKA70DRAFT_1305797 [Coprinopsis sp. MPI-PUGE-AT-0042]|nr:hypothetical protein BKA70DRAFT_1305797 [Coprinopsis sp. MPI-PUGE-AT-0042]
MWARLKLCLLCCISPISWVSSLPCKGHPNERGPAPNLSMSQQREGDGRTISLHHIQSPRRRPQDQHGSLAFAPFVFTMAHTPWSGAIYVPPFTTITMGLRFFQSTSWRS